MDRRKSVPSALKDQKIGLNLLSQKSQMKPVNSDLSFRPTSGLLLF